MRIDVLDGLRGVFLIFMCVIHLNRALDVTLGKLNHHYFGWVEDAQGFVFISGIVVGLVYGATLLRKGAGAMRSRVWARTRTIYAYQAALVLGFAFLASWLAANGMRPHIFTPYVDQPLAFTLASLGLISASQDLGILPMYIWFMLVTPAILVAFKNGQQRLVLIASAVSWLVMAQLGLAAQLGELVSIGFAEIGLTVRPGIFFNVFGWQVLFVGGLFVGYRLAENRFNLDFLENRRWLPVMFAALTVAVILGLFDRLIHVDALWPEFRVTALAHISRANFDALHVFAFAIDLFLLAWLLRAGPTAGLPIITPVAKIATQVLKSKPLVFLGQHSLQVFAWHIVLVYATYAILDGARVSEVTGSIILIAATASLWLAAAAHAWISHAASLPLPIKQIAANLMANFAKRVNQRPV